MTVYAIREKGTNKYLPNGIYSGGRLRPRGFTQSEPSDTLFLRLFPTIRSARNALTFWLQGKWSNAYGNNYDDAPYPEASKVEYRKKENTEIIEFELVEKND